MAFRFCVVLIVALLNVECSLAGDDDVLSKEEQHVEVSMRMIGHQLLLSLGDSTSHVLPVEKDNNRYRIRFDTEFGFNPEAVSSTVDSVIDATGIASSYIVAFETCDSNLIVHSYEVGIRKEYDVLACRTRDQPKACYNLLVTIFSVPETPDSTIAQTQSSSSKYWVLAVLLVCVLLPMVIATFFLNKKPTSNSKTDPSIISIGAYRFNKRKMELWFNEERIELTSKECDLLQLLCDSTNNTVERETILKMVWGDEGDYVGRTLDVFISKLRKKLEGDSNIKIANIRGVGYKLVVDA